MLWFLLGGVGVYWLMKRGTLKGLDDPTARRRCVRDFKNCTHSARHGYNPEKALKTCREMYDDCVIDAEYN